MADMKADTENSDEEKMPPPPTAQQKADILKLEEEKLKSKFPNLPGSGKPARGGHSSFLQKRLAKGAKFFDSGDYNVARCFIFYNLLTLYFLFRWPSRITV